jgi:hypothetical protein
MNRHPRSRSNRAPHATQSTLEVHEPDAKSAGGIVRSAVFIAAALFAWASGGPR